MGKETFNQRKQKRIAITIHVSTLEAALLDADALLSGLSRTQLMHARVFRDTTQAMPFLAILSALQRISRELTMRGAELPLLLELARCIESVEGLAREEVARS